MIRAFPQFVSKRVVWITTGVIVAALVVGFWPSQWSSSDFTGVSVNQAVVRRGDLTIEVPATGSLVAEHSADIGPPNVEGLWDFKIARLVSEGTHVKSGDMLVEFDGQEVNRRLTEQQAEMNKLQEELNKRKLEYDIQLRDLRIRVEESKVNLEKAKHKAEVDPSLTSLQEYKQAKIQLEEAQTEALRVGEKLQATLRMSKAELAALENNLENARMRLARLQDQQKALVVKAPMAGVVIYKRSWNGEKKQVGQSAWRLETIMQIPDLSTLRLDAMIEEVNAGGISPGQKARIRLDAFPELQLTGTVKTVGTVLRAKRWDIPIKVVDAVVELNHTEGKLLPGMTATALVEVQRIRNVLLVPIKAVREKERRPVVAVFDSRGKVEERPVKVGRRDSESIEILQGVREGEKIALETKTTL